MSPLPVEPSFVGRRFRSNDPRAPRTVVVTRESPSKVEVRNVRTGEVSFVSKKLLRSKSQRGWTEE